MNKNNDHITGEKKQPNILFLLSDEHSFRFMGHRPSADRPPVDTPTLDALAAAGTEFTDAYCQMPLCTPSRLCMLTGREAIGAGAWYNESVLSPDLETLPSTLADAGYQTCLVGKMHFGGSCQYGGFHARPYGDLTGRAGHQWEDFINPVDAKRDRIKNVGITKIPESLIQDQIVADETVGYLRNHVALHPEKPWFLCASFSRPHYPLTAPARWVERYRGRTTEPFVGKTGDAFDHPMSIQMRKGYHGEAISDEDAVKTREGYYAGLSYLDEVIGDILLCLETQGLLENTVIVYTSDHGEMLGEHGVWWKHAWYEGASHVPLIVSMPEQRRPGWLGTGNDGEYEQNTGQECHTPVGLIDLYPTLSALADAGSTDNDGRDLSPALSGKLLDDKPVFCDSLTPRWGKGTEFRSIRLRDYKYIRFRGHAPLAFNVEADPGEQKNLLARERDALTQEDRDAIAELENIADEIDFDEADRLFAKGEALRKEYPLSIYRGPVVNFYHMPDGRIVEAEHELYHPGVIADHPSEIYSDAPEA